MSNLENLQEDQEAELLSSMLGQMDPDQIRNRLESLSAYRIAAIISRESEENQALLFGVLEPPENSEVFDFLSFRIQKNLLGYLPNTEAAYLLNTMPPDDRTAFLQEMPWGVINELIKFLPLAERIETLTLLGYPEGSVGRLMTTDYIAVSPEWSIQRVLDHLLEYGHDSETISIIYVVDEKGKLIDDIKLRDFLFISRQQKVENLMDDEFVALSVDNSDEEAIHLFKYFDRVALPVTDHQGILLGIVTIDDVLRLSDKEATEDMQKMGGQEALDEPYMETPFFQLMKKRVGWLTILFLGEMLTATALSYFEKEIAAAVVLALFLPLIISSGGNAGGQATTLIVRALALGEIKSRDWWRIFQRELAAGLFLGIILGVVGFCRIAIWSQFTAIYGEHWVLIGLTLFISLMSVILWGTLSGALFPLLLHKFKIDPATSSAPFVATIVDVMGVIIYFLTASLILAGTIL